MSSSIAGTKDSVVTFNVFDVWEEMLGEKFKLSMKQSLNIELDMTGKNDAEPKKDSEPDERDTGVKPSILKALKQFEPSTPTNADKGHSYSREAI